MYRNVYFDSRQGNMHLWTWNEQGERIETIEKFKPYAFVECQNDFGYKSIYNSNLRKMEFKSNWERSKYIKDSGIKRIFYNLRPEQQYLIEKYNNLNADPSFSQNEIDTSFIDIEVYTCKYPLNTFVRMKTDSGEEEHSIKHIIQQNLGGNAIVWDEEVDKWVSLEKSCYTQTTEFPDPEEANYAINVITLYSTLQKKFFTWGLHGDYKPTQDNVVYVQCKTEKELLNNFLSYWKQYTPDICSGWNLAGFDLPYIINRLIKVFHEDKAKELSPVKSIYYRPNVTQAFGRSMGSWSIHGISFLDYMEVYKKFSWGQRESYSLNYIGEYELGEGKTKFNATDLSKLAIVDWKTFVDYNIQDVNLLVKLEEKLQYMKLVENISYKGLSPFQSAIGTIGVVTGVFAQAALKQGMIIPTFEHHNKESFSGGFVMEPKRGLQECIVSFDANSLYPNTIITLNISPETKLGKIISKNKESVILELIDGNRYTLSKEKFAAFIKKTNASISKAGVLFSQTKKGFCPLVIDDIYKERLDNKNLLQQKQEKLKKLSKHQEDEKILLIKQEIEHHKRLDKIQKVFLNSMYGYFSNNHSPLYDIDIASSITNTGQACVKQAGVIVDEWAKEKYNTTKSLLIYMDTDSNYLSIKELQNILGVDFIDSDGGITKACEAVAEEIEVILNSGIGEWAKKSLNSADSRLVFKREAICDIGLFLEKKRYILSIKNDEGVEANKMKFVGMEVARSSYSEPVKQLIRDIVDTVFKTRSSVETNIKYRESYEKFKNLTLEDISIRSSINDYAKWANKSQKFSIAKNTPVHVKGSIYYNTLLKTLGGETDHEAITSGQKIKWFYCAENKYQVSVMSYPDMYPDILNNVIHPDYKKMFLKLVTSSVKRILDACDWPIDDLSYEYRTNLFDLFR